MQSDILATQLVTTTGNLKTADGASDIAACRIKGVYYTASANGTVVFRDGGASGVIIFTLPMASAASGLLWIPDNGLWFKRGTPHVTVSGSLTGMTVFYG